MANHEVALFALMALTRSAWWVVRGRARAIRVVWAGNTHHETTRISYQDDAQRRRRLGVASSVLLLDDSAQTRSGTSHAERVSAPNARAEHPRLPTRHVGYPDTMEGGIAIFLLLLIIVAAVVLFFVLGGVGGITQGLNERRERREGRSRPTHTVVEDDGSGKGHPGDRLAH